MTLISIYGTIYNNVQTVNKTLKTLINSLPDFEDKFEVVIVDNFSVDGTWEILQKWKRRFKNIRLVRVKSSRGTGRNIALKHTQGDYVFHIDFDVYFKKEIKDLVEKFERICSPKTIIIPYVFSSRETLLAIGGWRDLNFGEDWEILARAVANKVKIKNVLMVPFNVNQIVKIREARYTKNKIGYGIRKIRNILDSYRGYNVYPKLFVNYFLRKYLKEFRPSSVLASIVYPIALINRFAYSKGFTNVEYVHENEEYILPQDIGFSSDYFFLTYDNIDITWRVVKKRLKEIVQKAKKLNFLMLEKSRTLVGYRKYDIIREYVEYLR